jgi:hypothetical protein
MEPKPEGIVSTRIAVVSLALLGCLYWLVGAFWPEGLPRGADSPARITGMALMLTLLPPYLIAASGLTRRRSLLFVEQLRSQLPPGGAAATGSPERGFAEEASAAIRSGLRRSWLPATVLGLIMGYLNASPVYAFTRSPTPAIDVAFAAGQILLWLLVALLLGMRVVAARAFSRLGSVVEFDLFRLDRLRPLARAGTLDVLVIAGAVAMSPLQSLDAEFRWYNYHFAFLVAVPAALFLLLWPLRSVHLRILAEKRRRLAETDAMLDQLRPGGSSEAVLNLETLLAHRDRLRDLRTWPLSTALVSRVFLYLIIPPLAWVGAAVVEMLVDRLLAG